MPEGVKTGEKTPSKDNFSSIFVHAVLIPSILLVAIPIALTLTPQLLITNRENSVTVSIGVPVLSLMVFFLVYRSRYGRYGRYGAVGRRDTIPFKKFWESPSKILINLFKVLNIILYAEIALLIVITALFYSIPEGSTIHTYLSQGEGFYPLQFTLGYTIYIIVAYLATRRYFSRDFQFILAQKCMIEAKAKDEEAEKISHLIDGLSSYNKYLKRCFDLQFDETRVASNIISSSSDKNQKVKEIAKSFSIDYDYIPEVASTTQQAKSVDNLKPANCLSTFANLEPKEQFLKAKQLSTRIKEILTVLAAIIPAAIGVIQLVYPQP